MQWFEVFQKNILLTAYCKNWCSFQAHKSFGTSKSNYLFNYKNVANIMFGLASDYPHLSAWRPQRMSTKLGDKIRKFFLSLSVLCLAVLNCFYNTILMFQIKGSIVYFFLQLSMLPIIESERENRSRTQATHAESPV